MKKIFLLISVFCLVFSMQVFAKNNIDNTSPSVQLLKTLNDEGKYVRENDTPVQKIDTSQDTSRRIELKQKFFDECYSDGWFLPRHKKDPDKENRGAIE
ncbi:MAG: hypothetical protein MJ180_01965 [Candidatus Gastranaerophilales bacterium]|nr:hypothetical protein [Candidatus Gastranaerophilales bacterium]